MESFDKLPNALIEMMVVLGLDDSSDLDCLVNICFFGGVRENLPSQYRTEV